MADLIRAPAVRANSRGHSSSIPWSRAPRRPGEPLAWPCFGCRAAGAVFALRSVGLAPRATPPAVSEHSSELIGCPISGSLTTSCARLELRSLPSAGVTQLRRYYEPLRLPRALGLSLAGVRLVIADRALGVPVLRTLSLCTCCRHYPGAAAGPIPAHSPSRISLPRKGRRVGLRIVLFEACSAFTRVTACTLALPPVRDTLTRGFSHFVASMTAPAASGWSGCRVGLAPTGKRRLITAHTRLGHRQPNLL